MKELTSQQLKDLDILRNSSNINLICTKTAIMQNYTKVLKPFIDWHSKQTIINGRNSYIAYINSIGTIHVKYEIIIGLVEISKDLILPKKLKNMDLAKTSIHNGNKVILQSLDSIYNSPLNINSIVYNIQSGKIETQESLIEELENKYIDYIKMLKDADSRIRNSLWNKTIPENILIIFQTHLYKLNIQDNSITKQLKDIENQLITISRHIKSDEVSQQLQLLISQVTSVQQALNKYKT